MAVVIPNQPASAQFAATSLVVVEEVKSGDWGIGGNPITTSDAKALAAGKSKG